MEFLKKHAAVFVACGVAAIVIAAIILNVRIMRELETPLADSSEPIVQPQKKAVKKVAPRSVQFPLSQERQSAQKKMTQRVSKPVERKKSKEVDVTYQKPEASFILIN